MKKPKKVKTKSIEIYLTRAEELSLKFSLKDLNTIKREFAIQNIVEIFEKANKRKDINWIKYKN